MITFTNSPKLSGHEVDHELDEGRKKLVLEIGTYLNAHILFKDIEIVVSFFHTGVSSLVSLIEAEQEKYVLKIQLRKEGKDGEALFLQTWEQAGVCIPHICETGVLSDYRYILMQYIEAKTLDTFTEQELLDKKIFYRMGQTLQAMHSTKATGYGNITGESSGEYPDFDSWLSGDPHIKNQLIYMREHNLLPEERYMSINNALDTLKTYIGSNPESVYCHFDFSPGNIFYTEPLTVFDPVVLFNHPYLDLAKSIIQTVANNFTTQETTQQIIAGYFSENTEKLNKNILKASLLFISYTKFPYWHKKDHKEVIARVEKFLELFLIY